MDTAKAKDSFAVEKSPENILNWRDRAEWKIRWLVEKFKEAPEEIVPGVTKPYEVIEWEENLLMYGGASCLWECLIGNGTASAGQALTYFNNGNAAIGVGDSTTAEAATQNDLQASTNKLRKAMDATYPTHTDATTSGAATITFKSTFATGEANFAWQELAIFNSATAATGRMLNRKVQSLGTKTTGSWSVTGQITLA